MIPYVFEWNGHGPMSILAEHAHVHRDGKCVKNRYAVACDLPRASVLGELSPITTERVNHVAEAKRVMTDGEHTVGRARDAAANGNHRVADGYGAKAHGCWMQAQVHATLALVEQQRIANLQAERRDLRARAIGRTDDRAMEYRQTASSLDVEIREALGLS